MRTLESAGRAMLAALIIGWIVFFGPPAHATSQKEYEFAIEREPIAPAIRAFSMQSGLQIGFSPESPADEEILVGPIKGVFTADTALRRLLDASGLTHEWLNERALYIHKPNIVLAAQTQQQTVTSSHSIDLTRSKLDGFRDGGLDQEAGVVVVLGTRLSDLESGSQSTTVLSRKKIESYGVSTLPDLIHYLPQIPFSRPEDYRPAGEQFASLRGLGSGTTLILINGRRVSGSATSFDVGGFDLNTIPLTAVKRIELMFDTPSIAAGTDAIGGVINIVLKDDIPSPIVEASYGAVSGGAAERRASLGLGTSQGNFFSGAATLDLFQRMSLFGSERDFSRNQDFRRFGGTDYRSVQSNPGNVMSLTGDNLPGLSSSFAAISPGLSGATVADFAPTAGQLNQTSLYAFRTLTPETSRASLVASGNLALTNSIKLFGELLSTQRGNKFQYGPPTLSVMVPVSNPYNPFGVPVIVNALLQPMSAQSITTESSLVRLVSGMRGTWNRWEGELSATWSQDHSTATRENQLDPSRVTQALGASDPSSALNLFGGSPGSAALLASLVARPLKTSFSSVTEQGYARLAGPILNTRAGDITLLAGGEWRREALLNPSLPTAPDRHILTTFAQLQIPFVSAAMDVPAVRELSLSAGARVDRYWHLETSVAPQYSLTWGPMADLKFHTTYSEGYRVPSLYELYAPKVSIPVALADPRRHNQTENFAVLSGGNPTLESGAGYSWTTGLDFSPHWAPTFHVSAAYWRIAMPNNITSSFISAVLVNEALLPGRVVRATPTVQDIAAGLPGVLQSVDLSPGNFGSLRTSGMDLNASFVYETRIGRFTPDVSLTWTDNYQTTVVSGSAAQERVGIASELGSIARWRAVLSLEWERGPFTVHSAARFRSHYDDAMIGIKTGQTVSAQTLFDLQFALQLDTLTSPTSYFRGTRLSAGATNLFNQAPPFAQVGYFFGYDPSQNDLRQRFWYMRLAKQF